MGTARLCVSLQGRPSGPPCVPSRGFQAVPRELDLGVIFWGFYFSQMLNKLVMEGNSSCFVGGIDPLKIW